MFLALMFSQKSQTLNFDGGSAVKFVSEAAKTVKSDVIAVYARDEKVAPIQIDMSQKDSAFTTINSKTSFMMIGGTKWLMHDRFYPEEWFTKLSNKLIPSPSTNAVGINKMVKDGKVTWDCRSQGVFSFGDLKKANFSKPITVFWMFRPEAAAVKVKDEPEKLFLIDLAKAVGGQLISDDKTYQIIPDWSSAFQRLDNTVGKMIARDTSEPYTIQLKRELWKAILDQIGSGYMGDFLDKPMDPKDLTVGASSPFASSVLDYVRQLTAKEASSNNRRDDRQASSIINRLDTRMPAKVRISQDGDITVEVAVLDARRRRSSYIRI